MSIGYKKWSFAGVALLLLASVAYAQVSGESAVRGNLAGTVFDSSGAVVPGAKITITGPIGARTVESDDEGKFVAPLLTPGYYTLRVEKQGFKLADVKGVEVVTNRTTGVRVNLLPGAVSEVVEVTAAAVTVDLSSTAIGANLTDSFYTQVPVGRNVSALFYATPGVTSGGGTGAANPSISGGSGLENQYVADGVNITDAAFGGLGVFSRSYGPLATGINLSFVKEVQVKTGGFEPQYGKSTGGVVQIVTKSGSSDFHGAVSGFVQSRGMSVLGTPLHPDDFGRVNQRGKLLDSANYDASVELGGYIPGFRDKVFFFGSFNPSLSDRYVLAPETAGLFALGDIRRRTITYNYAFKGTLKLSENHSLESSIFGDPSHTQRSAFRRLVMDNDTAFSKLQFGTRNWVARYNGALSPTWLVNASFSWGENRFDENGFGDFQRISDETQTGGLSGQRGVFTPVGLGFFEPTEANTFGFNVDTSKTFRAGGDHTFSIGYRLERPFYDGERARSGPDFIVPGTNMDGIAAPELSGLGFAVGQPANAELRLRLADPATCTACPLFPVPGLVGTGPNGESAVLLQITRSEFGLPNVFETNATYHAIYANDSWSPNKYVTLNLGLRWEQQKLEGDPSTGQRYTFTANWSPRVGVSVDPFGDKKTKVFANFGRYAYALPLDVAERSLSGEQGLFGLRFAPDFTVDGAGNRLAVINQFGTVNPILDAAHVLNGAAGGVTDSAVISFQSTTGFAPGTKMSYLDEFVVGAEREFEGGVVASVRYVRRDLKRAVEDTGGISPEAALAGISQVFQIGNVSSSTDLFSNPIPHAFAPGGPLPGACDPALVLDPVQDTFGNSLGAVCFEPTAANGETPGAAVPDGIPDGFPDAVRRYWAVEFEVNKAFSKNWQLRANYRIARLFGNFEGAFRNDNGQSDPGISSLFDFTEGDFNLLGDQFALGELNTDRRHVINGFFSYTVDRTALKGLTVGTGVRIESGIPLNDFKAHPVYENPGEVPVGGRGALGRTPINGTVDAHVDYVHNLTERFRARVGVDIFNIGNSRRALFLDQNEDIAFGTPNVDFRRPDIQSRLGDAFQAPASIRFFARFEF